MNEAEKKIWCLSAVVLFCVVEGGERCSNEHVRPLWRQLLSDVFFGVSFFLPHPDQNNRFNFWILEGGGKKRGESSECEGGGDIL